MNDAQVTNFVTAGTITILGHELGPEDLRIMYNFGDAGASNKYEADSDNDVLVLLDCTPDKSMLDEGCAREVVNRIQKLRKKAGLQPQDEVTLYYKVKPSGHDLLRIINEYTTSIESSTKNPIVLESTTNRNDNKKLVEEDYDLKGLFKKIILHIYIYRRSLQDVRTIPLKINIKEYIIILTYFIFRSQTHIIPQRRFSQRRI